MLLMPSRIFIDKRDPVVQELLKIPYEKIDDLQLREDVKYFIDGKNPWLV
jgi:hypothetical protein